MLRVSVDRTAISSAAVLHLGHVTKFANVGQTHYKKNIFLTKQMITDETGSFILLKFLILNYY